MFTLTFQPMLFMFENTDALRQQNADQIGCGVQSDCVKRGTALDFTKQKMPKLSYWQIHLSATSLAWYTGLYQETVALYPKPVWSVSLWVRNALPLLPCDGKYLGKCPRVIITLHKSSRVYDRVAMEYICWFKCGLFSSILTGSRKSGID